MSGNGSSRPRRVLVTATPPTPNGDLHLGHLSGPYLGADIYHRYLRIRGVESYSLTGIDDSQSYVTVKGHQLGMTSEETARKFGDRMTATLDGAAMEFDQVGRPDRSEEHLRQVQGMFTELYESGAFEEREEEHLHCESCERYIFEAFVSGQCPHCGSSSGGNLCEACGRPNDCADMTEVRCVVCGSTPVRRRARRLYFPLSRYRDELERYVRSTVMSPHLLVVCEDIFAAGLPDISMSHISQWGIPVPVPGFEGQTIYVWFEMAPGFLAATQELAERKGLDGWESFWHPQRSAGHRVVQFFGVDNGFFYALLFPAIFLAWKGEVRLPETLVVNEFYRLEGSKFSTSRNHAIWGEEILARLSSDQVRFYMAYTSPKREETNFLQEECDWVLGKELRRGWQGWLVRLGQRVREEAEGKAPAGAILDRTHDALRHRLRELVASAETAYEAETFSPQAAARICTELVRTSRDFHSEQSYWQRNAACREAQRASLALELLAAKTLAIISYPLMPHFASRLWRELGFTSPMDSIGEARWESNPTWLEPDQPVAFATAPYFPEERPRSK